MSNLRELAQQVEGWKKEVVEETVEFTRMVDTVVEYKPYTWQEKLGAFVGKKYTHVVLTPEKYNKVVGVEKNTYRYNVLKNANSAYSTINSEVTCVAWLLAQKRMNSELWQALNESA